MPKPNLWSIACTHSWLLKDHFTYSIYWPGDFFQPINEFENYKSYNLVLPWTDQGIQKIPSKFRGKKFKMSTCPGSIFLEGKPKPVPSSIKEIINKNIFKHYIVYIGGLSTRRVDFKLLNYLARNLPKCAILMGAKSDGEECTTTQINELLDCKNVFLFETLLYEQLPSLVNLANVCIIPYLNNKWNSGICPNKMFEYASLGKPIVSTPIPSALEYSPPLTIANGKSTFLEKLSVYLSSSQNSQSKKELFDMARKASSKETIDRINSLIN